MLKVYDENLHYLKSMSRGDVHNSANNWHQTVHMFIYNNTENILYLQKRSELKDLYPNMLISTASGHIDDSETPDETLIKETSEELGLDLDINDVNYLGICRYYNEVGGMYDYEFINVYLLLVNESPDFILNEEVSNLEVVNVDDFRKLVIDYDNKLVPTWPVYHMILEWIRLKKLI